MRENRPAPQAPYALRSTMSRPGLMDPRAAMLLWGSGSIVIGLVITYLLIQGEFRLIVLLMLSMLGLACLSPRRGVYILTAFLPFMYFIRRQVLNFQEFDRRDPILLFPALTTLAIFLGVIIFYRTEVLGYIRRSTLLKAVCFLMFWFALEVINPLQGSVLVGAAGALFFIVPPAWCFLGLLMTREDITRILKLVVVIGFITALYGLYQHFFGFSAVEIYELKAKQFFKTFSRSSDVRVMSTFSSLGDFSLYLSVAAFISFGRFWQTKNSLLLFLLFILSLYTMLWTAVRTSFLLVLFSIAILLISYGKSARQVLSRGIAALVAILIIYGVLYTYDPAKMYDQKFTYNPYVVHTLSGITHPTEENTFKIRIQNWLAMVEGALTQSWVGHGIGSTTVAASKFEGGTPFEADSYFFELFYGSGLIAPPIFALIVYFALRSLLTMSLRAPDVYLFKICLALLAGLFLGSVFGTAVRDTIVGPLAWLIIGWTAKEAADGQGRTISP